MLKRNLLFQLDSKDAIIQISNSVAVSSPSFPVNFAINQQSFPASSIIFLERQYVSDKPQLRGRFANAPEVNGKV